MPVSPQRMDDLKGKTKLEQIYLLYKDDMLQIADNILHNQQDDEDAVHEAFLSIARNIKKFSNPGSPQMRCYVIVTAERKALDIYREHKRHPKEALTEDAESNERPSEPDENFLMDCINRLSDRDREAIILRYYCGYHIKEISQMLGISYAAAAKSVERAKKRLSRLCREEGLF